MPKEQARESPFVPRQLFAPREPDDGRGCTYVDFRGLRCAQRPADKPATTMVANNRDTTTCWMTQ
jgi:hypothetical protein